MITGSDRVSVIVCTRNRSSELNACLAALAGQTIREFEVLVVDNASTPPVADICARWGGRYVLEPHMGLCVARNTGARCATGEIIAYLDDDALPEPTWLKTLLEGFADPSVACVTGRIRYMKTVGNSRAMTDEEAARHSAGRPRRVFGRTERNWYALACLGGIGDGSNMAFRRKDFLASPGFDERIGRGRSIEGGDEHVLFMSLLALGHRIAHVPEAVVRHPYPTAPEMVKATKFRERRASIAYLLFLWYEFPTRRVDILHHLVTAVARRVRAASVGSRPDVGLTYAQALRAAAGGIGLYRQARGEWADIPTPIYQGLALAS